MAKGSLEAPKASSSGWLGEGCSCRRDGVTTTRARRRLDGNGISVVGIPWFSLRAARRSGELRTVSGEA